MREEWVLGAWLGGALYDVREFEYYELQSRGYCSRMRKVKRSFVRQEVSDD